MLSQDAGGLPPKGLDFNGIFYELSSPIAHYCRGDRIQFDATYAAAIGGYAKGAIVASNDYQKDYISLVDNNLADPNGTNTTWSVYAGQGSVPLATSSTTGTVKLVNNLISSATDAALTAAQGKDLQDNKLDKTNALGFNQSWQNVSSSRQSGVTYQNNTGKPIQVIISVFSTNSVESNVLKVGGITLFDGDLGTGGMVSIQSFIVPNGASYIFTTTAQIRSWSELR